MLVAPLKCLTHKERTMSYNQENEAKADFDDVYIKPTPHSYISTMSSHGYQIGEQARPYFKSAADLLGELNQQAWPVQMLDIGCSYGIGSALVKYGCSFDEIVSFYSSRAPMNYASCCDVMRTWLNVTPPACDIRCVGLDSSAPAIKFALDSGLLDGGIARNYENGASKKQEAEEIAWYRSCNLLVSCGAIGYVTDKTLNAVLTHLGKDHPGSQGPFAVMTILRMFDTEAIASTFERYGYRFEAVPGIILRQRKFIDEQEKIKIIQLIQNLDISTQQWEDTGELFAHLYIAARPDQFSKLKERMECMRADGATYC